jgi:hypothetical protein
MDAQKLTKNYEKKIDSLIQTEFGNKNEPGGFLVSQKGKNIYRKAFGKANLS